jgi:hypothetical protein
MKTKFWDKKPQLAEIKSGPEPSLREVLKHYYVSHDIPGPTANTLVEDYIREISKPDPIPTSGPCLICGAHATQLRGDGYGPGVFCCYGPGCIPF